MATIKSFSDLEQSKKLAEILPLESADMNWHELPSIGLFVRAFPYKHDNGATEGIFPCWSLAGLLGVLPEYNLQRTDWTNKTEYKIVVTINDDNYVSGNYDNPVDACYQLIQKLHELKML